MSIAKFLGGFIGVLASVVVCSAATAQAPSTPTGLTASQGTVANGIQLSWTPVAEATSYEISTYVSLFTGTRKSAISVAAANGVFLNSQPCGVYYYFEVAAKNDFGLSARTSRVLGYTPSCAGAVQSCAFTAVPLTSTGSITFNTEGSQNNVRIGDRSTPCEDGNDPGTAGTGEDIVFTYVSGVDCTLTVTLDPDGAFESILYVSDDCEAYSCDYYSNVVAGVDTVTLPVVKDTPYYIFVDGYNNFEGQRAGTFTLTLDTDDCTAPAACESNTYGFDNGALPAGWTVVDRENGGPESSGNYALGAWGVIEDLSGSPYNRVVAALASQSGLVTTDDWLIAGPFNLDQSSNVTWRDARVGGGGDFELGLYVASTPTPDAFLFEGLVYGVVTVDVASTMTTRIAPMEGAAAANGPVYLGFRYRGFKSGFILLDDIGVCGATPAFHTSDQDGNAAISLGELLRVIQFYNSLRLHCELGTEDGFAPGAGDETCAPHASDYAPVDWVVSLSELLRLIQFYNSGGYTTCEGSEDGYCPGAG